MKEIKLRQWEKEDSKALAKAADNPHIAENLRNVFPSPYTLADAQWFIDDCIARAQEAGQLFRAILADGAVVRSISICRGTDVYEKSAELGYWLAEEHWNKGIMSGAVRQMCREAFAVFDIVRIYAEPFAYNTGSRRVLEKAGFTCEGIMRNGVYKNGQMHSYCMYALLKEEAAF